LRDHHEHEQLRSEAVFGIDLDRINNQIELIGGVDFPGNAPQMVRRNLHGFREVVKPVEAFGMAVLHDENNTGLAVISILQREIIRAEVKHIIYLNWGRVTARDAPHPQRR